MKIRQTALKGVVLIEPELVAGGVGEISKDMRGFFVETYNEEKYRAAGITVTKDVLRGMHGDGIIISLR